MKTSLTSDSARNKISSADCWVSQKLSSSLDPGDTQQLCLNHVNIIAL